MADRVVAAEGHDYQVAEVVVVVVAVVIKVARDLCDCHLHYWNCYFFRSFAERVGSR